MFFDVANRQTCTVKLARTNTPLHALVTLNDVTYVEAARALAQRVLLGSAGDDAGASTEAFRRADGPRSRNRPSRKSCSRRLERAAQDSMPTTKPRRRSCWPSANRRAMRNSTRRARRLDEPGDRDPEPG